MNFFCENSVYVCSVNFWSDLYRRILRTWALRRLILLQFLPKATLWMMNNKMTKKIYTDMFIIY